MTFQPASRPSTPTRHRAGQPPRRGFTLIELMVVIVVIAMLIAILIPALSAVLTNARLTQAKTDLTAIENSIADFKSQFGSEPPSYLDFRATSANALPAATKAQLRKMFPQIQFDGTLTTALNEAGLLGKELRGPEALVFFLGGVRKLADLDSNGTLDFTNELSGFSKNPSNPFAQVAAGQTNRIGPFHEFDPSRLGEVERIAGVFNSINTDVTKFIGNPLAYLDTLEGQTKPIIYVSTARTRSYNASDAGVNGWSPYRSATGSFHNSNGFQLISPGYDQEYGVGGQIPASGAVGPDADNITNFSSGTTLGG